MGAQTSGSGGSARPTTTTKEWADWYDKQSDDFKARVEADPKKSAADSLEGIRLTPTGASPCGGRIKAGRTGFIADGRFRSPDIPDQTRQRKTPPRNRGDEAEFPDGPNVKGTPRTSVGSSQGTHVAAHVATTSNANSQPERGPNLKRGRTCPNEYTRPVGEESTAIATWSTDGGEY